MSKCPTTGVPTSCCTCVQCQSPTTPAQTSAETLWCLHTLGPDEVHAAPSKLQAEIACAWYRERMKHHADVLRFEVKPWPWSREAHALSLPRWRCDVFPTVALRQLLDEVEKEPANG